MKLPLNICQAYGRFAYSDEQKGIEAVKLIEDYIEDYQSTSSSVESSQARQIAIERNQKGEIVAAKSVKLLPNMQINLRTPLKSAQHALFASGKFVAMAGFLTQDWLVVLRR